MYEVEKTNLSYHNLGFDGELPNWNGIGNRIQAASSKHYYSTILEHQDVLLLRCRLTNN